MGKQKLHHWIAIVLLSMGIPTVGLAQNIEQWEKQIDSLLHQQTTSSGILTLINLIHWDSPILRAIPSISPVRLQQTSRLSEKISSPFGQRIHPIFHHQHVHSGIDIPGHEKDTIYAAADGVISEKGMDKQLGGFIKIQHQYSFISIYGHMRKALCNIGDTVMIGQPIGLMGTTGNSTGPHLHYSIRFRGQLINPLPFCYVMFEYLSRKQTEQRPPE